MIEYCGIFVSGGLVFTELCMKSIYIFTKWNIIYNNRAKYVHRNLILNYMYFFIVLVSLLLSYQIKVLQRENVFVYINMLLTNFFHMQEIFARFARASLLWIFLPMNQSLLYGCNDISIANEWGLIAKIIYLLNHVIKLSQIKVGRYTVLRQWSIKDKHFFWHVQDLLWWSMCNILLTGICMCIYTCICIYIVYRYHITCTCICKWWMYTYLCTWFVYIHVLTYFGHIYWGHLCFRHHQERCRDSHRPQTESINKSLIPKINTVLIKHLN